MLPLVGPAPPTGDPPSARPNCVLTLPVLPKDDLQESAGSAHRGSSIDSDDAYSHSDTPAESEGPNVELRSTTCHGVGNKSPKSRKSPQLLMRSSTSVIVPKRPRASVVFQDGGHEACGQQRNRVCFRSSGESSLSPSLRHVERRHTLDLDLQKLRSSSSFALRVPEHLGEQRKPCVEAGETFLALQRSALGLHERRVEELLDAGVSANISLREEGEGGAVHFVTLLHQLCGLPIVNGGHAEPGSIGVMEALLRAGANVSSRSSTGMTPLMRASRERNVDAVELLLHWNAQVELIDDFGNTSLLLAVTLPEEGQGSSTRRPSSTRFRNRELAGGGDLTAGLVDMLFAASEQQEQERVEHGIRSPHRRRHTSDEELGTFGNLSHVETSMAKSSTLNSNYCASKTAADTLHQCVLQGNVKAIHALLSHGVEPLFLQEAVESGKLDVVWTLLEFRANPLIMDDAGVSPMDYALQQQSMLGSGTFFDEVLDALRSKALLTVPIGDELVRDLASSLPGDGTRKKSLGKVLSMHYGKASTRATPLAEDAGRRLHWAAQGVQKQLAKRCQVLYESQFFQALALFSLLGALALPDLWVLMDNPSSSQLDALLLVILALFIFELQLQVVAYRRAYFCTFFFLWTWLGHAPFSWMSPTSAT